MLTVDHRSATSYSGTMNVTYVRAATMSTASVSPAGGRASTPRHGRSPCAQPQCRTLPPRRPQVRLTRTRPAGRSRPTIDKNSETDGATERCHRDTARREATRRTASSTGQNDLARSRLSAASPTGPCHRDWTAVRAGAGDGALTAVRSAQPGIIDCNVDFVTSALPATFSLLTDLR